METKFYTRINKTIEMCLEKKISRIALTSIVLWRHKKKASFKKNHGYLHSKMTRIDETFLIATKLGIIT